MGRRFIPGIDILLKNHLSWLKGYRVGLLSHAAAISSDGRASLQRLWHAADVRLVALFGPEHGFLAE